MTLILNLLSFAALGFTVVFPISFAVTGACRLLLSWRHRVRRAREEKAAAVRDHLPDAGEMVGAVVVIGDTPAELVSFDLKLPAGIPESEAYRWN